MKNSKKRRAKASGTTAAKDGDANSARATRARENNSAGSQSGAPDRNGDDNHHHNDTPRVDAHTPGKNGTAPLGHNGTKPSPPAPLASAASLHLFFAGADAAWNAIRPHTPTPLTEAEREEMVRLDTLLPEEMAVLAEIDAGVAAMNELVANNQHHLEHE
jgi:hypothetical protein